MTVRGSPTASIEIRTITLADIPSYQEALDAVTRERRWTGLVAAPALSSTAAFVEGQLEKGHPMVVAVEGGAVLGWCDISVSDRATLAHGGRLGMGVLDGHRGRGIGRAVLHAALEAADKAGLERVELDVLAHNAIAIALYEKANFVQEGLRRRAWRLDGVYGDLVMMARFAPGADQTQAPKSRPAAIEPMKAKPR
ncbi:MAG: GNAT family N-acetyltransferase [Pseudomonadota bacterium]